MATEFLGDPHLGRSFVNNVPLHRRGEREKMVWDDFQKSVLDTRADLHICLGDIFDKSFVNYATILKAAETYRYGRKATQYVILQGNHDAGKDTTKVTAFDVFAELLADKENITVLKEPEILETFVFFPWHPIKPATEIVHEFLFSFQDQDFSGYTAVGHWDVHEMSDPFNLIPTAQLQAFGIKQAVTGHDHLRRSFVRDGVHVNVHGSMQPYAFGEQSDDKLYVEMTKAEVEAADPESYRNKCVKIRLQAGETFDDPIDALSVSVVREAGEDEAIEVDLGTFDIDTLFKQAFEEHNVPEEFRTLVTNRYQERSAQ